MQLGLNLEKPERQTRASKNGENNGQSDATRKTRVKQYDTAIEHGRASVRRAKDGGLIITRQVTLLTFLPPKNFNGWVKG